MPLPSFQCSECSKIVELPSSYSEYEGQVKCPHCQSLWEVKFSYGFLKVTPKLIKKRRDS